MNVRDVAFPFLMHNVRRFFWGIFNEEVWLDQRPRERNISDIKQMKERSPLNYIVKFYKGLTIYSAIARNGPFGTKLI